MGYGRNWSIKLWFSKQKEVKFQEFIILAKNQNDVLIRIAGYAIDWVERYQMPVFPLKDPGVDIFNQMLSVRRTKHIWYTWVFLAEFIEMYNLILCWYIALGLYSHYIEEPNLQYILRRQDNERTMHWLETRKQKHIQFTPILCTPNNSKATIQILNSYAKGIIINKYYSISWATSAV